MDRLVLRTLEQDTETLREEKYVYDERGRLVDYTCTGSQRPEDPYRKVIDRQEFGFDAQDNLFYLKTTFDGGTHTIDFEYHNENDPCQLTGLVNTLDPELPDDPLYPERIDFRYDLDGNLLQDEVGRLLSYDSLGRLISVSVQAGETDTGYRYDSLNMLSGLGRSAGNEQRFYQNDKLVNQVKEGASNTFVHANGTVLAERQDGDGPKS